MHGAAFDVNKPVAHPEKIVNISPDMKRHANKMMKICKKKGTPLRAYSAFQDKFHNQLK